MGNPDVINPDEAADFAAGDGSHGVAVVACGALAREILDIIKMNGIEWMTVTCLPASLHNRSEQIPERLREKIRKLKPHYDAVFVAYADCGTGGQIDRVISEEGGRRIGGPHCYSFFAGHDRFEEIAEQEIGTFYLTDYLARHFDTLIVKGMGLDRYPEMRNLMFGNYRRLVYLAQTDDPQLTECAERAADRLGLAFERIYTGYGELGDFIARSAQKN